MDPIDRQAAIDAIFSEPLYESGMKKRDADVVVPAIYEKIKTLPSAQQDCTECSEYDNETKSCPKYCDVIRQTLAEAKPERTDCNNCNEYDNEMKDCPHYCEVMRSTEDGLQIEAYCNKRKLPEEVQEPTFEQIKEYCHRRCLTIITNDLYHDLITAYSAQPERTGRWVKISPAGIYECNLCGKYVMTDEIKAYAFCHGCGARMEGQE